MAGTKPRSLSLTARRRRRNERRRKSKSISNVSFCFLLWLTNHITDRLVRGRIQSGEGYRSEKRGSETRGRLEYTGGNWCIFKQHFPPEVKRKPGRPKKTPENPVCCRFCGVPVLVQSGVSNLGLLLSSHYKTNLSRYPRSNPQDSISQIVMIIKHNH